MRAQRQVFDIACTPRVILQREGVARRDAAHMAATVGALGVLAQELHAHLRHVLGLAGTACRRFGVGPRVGLGVVVIAGGGGLLAGDVRDRGEDVEVSAQD